MTKIAVDIALLLPEDISDLIININKNLDQKAEDFIYLNKKDFLPHITIAMGVIDLSKLPSIKKKLNQVASRHSNIKIILSKVEIFEENNEKSSWFVVEKSKDLISLHKDVVKKMKEFFTYDGKVDMFYAPPLLEMLPNFWIKNNHKNLILDKYAPHITLGKGVPKKINLPIEFKASKIALCHLGKGCTCRKILDIHKLR